MKIKVKSYKTPEEQVEILNKWGNNFLNINLLEKEKVLKYFRKYSFQNFVEPFKNLLWTNYNLDTNEDNSHFIDGFKFNDLIQLRFFDKHLKNVLGNLLDKVEETLRESIIIHTLNSISAISKKEINLPFLLLDDEWSVIISQNIFTNNLSRQSYVNNDGEFNFDDYYSFIAKYLSPFNGDSLFLNDIDLKKFYFYNVYVNHQQLASLNHFRQYKSLSEKTEQLIPIEIEDEKGKNIFCTFRNFFIWCMKNKKYQQDLRTIKLPLKIVQFKEW